MNTKLILPGSLALVFHAFVLFGLSGKTPPPEVTKPTPAALPTDVVPVDADDPPPITPIDEPEEHPAGPNHALVPYIPEPPCQPNRADDDNGNHNDIELKQLATPDDHEPNAFAGRNQLDNDERYPCSTESGT